MHICDECRAGLKKRKLNSCRQKTRTTNGVSLLFDSPAVRARRDRGRIAAMSGRRIAFFASAPILGGIIGVVGYRLIDGPFFMRTQSFSLLLGPGY